MANKEVNASAEEVDLFEQGQVGIGGGYYSYGVIEQVAVKAEFQWLAHRNQLPTYAERMIEYLPSMILDSALISSEKALSRAAATMASAYFLFMAEVFAIT